MSSLHSESHTTQSVSNSPACGNSPRRPRVVIGFLVAGFLAGCLSGYLFYASPNARHYPGHVFGVAIAIMAGLYHQKRRLVLPVFLVVASIAGFHFAVSMWLETGFRQTVEHLAMAIVGVLPICVVMFPCLEERHRWPFVGMMVLASMIGLYGFAKLTYLRSNVEFLPMVKVLDPRRLAVFDMLRFATWQSLVAGVLGYYMPTTPPRSKPRETARR